MRTNLAPLVFLCLTIGCNSEALVHREKPSARDELLADARAGHLTEFEMRAHGQHRSDNRGPVFERSGTARSLQVSYGIAPAAAMDSGIAKIVRDPNGEHQTLVVFSEGHLTERLYLFARSAILFDRSVEPVPTSRRVITIFPDERLRLDADGATKWTVLRASFAAVGNSFANAVAASRSKAKTIHVDGLGPVTLLHDANFEAP